MSKRILALFFGVMLLLSGCSVENLEKAADTIGDLYETYGPGQVRMPEDSEYYPFRRQMHHEAFSGNAYEELNNNTPFSGLHDIGLHSGEVSYQEISSGRASGGSVFLSGISDLTDDGQTDFVPPGFSQVSYPGVTPYGALYEKILLVPEEFGGKSGEMNTITGTEYLAANLRECVSDLITFLESIDLNENPGAGLYFRATAIYSGLNGVCHGVLIEAESTGTDAVRFCRYYYNVQPGITIDYMTGDSRLDAAPVPEPETEISDSGKGEETDGTGENESGENEEET